MRDLWYLVRFFHIVPPVPSMLSVGVSATGTTSTVMVLLALVSEPSKARNTQSV